MAEVTNKPRRKVREPKQNDGKKLEGEVKRALEYLQMTEPCVMHRYVDSKRSRNFVESQPSDFSALHRGKFFAIECKSTVVGTSLRKMVSTKEGRRQIARGKQTIRAGGYSLFVHYDETKDRLAIHDTRRLVDGEWDDPVVVRGLDDVVVALRETFERMADGY